MKECKEKKYTITIQEEGKQKLASVFIVGGDFNDVGSYAAGVKEAINEIACAYFNKYYNKRIKKI